MIMLTEAMITFVAMPGPAPEPRVSAGNITFGPVAAPVTLAGTTHDVLVPAASAGWHARRHS